MVMTFPWDATHFLQCHKSLTSLCWWCKVEVTVPQWLHFLTDGKCNQCSSHNFQLLHSGGHYDFGSRPQLHLLPKRVRQHSLTELHKLKGKETGTCTIQLDISIHKLLFFSHLKIKVLTTICIACNYILGTTVYDTFFSSLHMLSRQLTKLRRLTKVVWCWNSMYTLKDILNL